MKEGGTQNQQKFFLGAFLIDAGQAARQLAAFLSEHGWHVVQTFDLQAARHGWAHCSCAHHGQETCSCQMIVLLAYPSLGNNPVSLVLHGRDGRTQVSLVGAAHRVLTTLSAWVAHVLGPEAYAHPRRLER